MGFIGLLNWWRITGSNRRPLRCQRSALPAELIPQLRSESIDEFYINSKVILENMIKRGKV